MVLNFASYKNAGGKFIEGSIAQEESLCHESILYNVLSQQTYYYDWNNKHKNKALYLNRALYTEDVVFIRDNVQYYCDVLTCASPNITVGKKYGNVTIEENSKVLRDRIDFILKIAKNRGAETLILGAFGCGVFGQNPTEVAIIFKELLEKYPKCFKRVVFAIPDLNGKNNKSFKKVFNI